LIKIYKLRVDSTEPGVDDTEFYSQSIAELRRHAKTLLGGQKVGADATIRCYTIGRPNLAMVLAVLNERGFAHKIELVETWERTACGKCPECYNGYHGHCEKPITRKQKQATA
jgi:hypothetical protein